MRLLPRYLHFQSSKHRARQASSRAWGGICFSAWAKADRCLRRRRFLRHDTNVVVDDLKKASFDVELLAAAPAESKHTFAEQRHHRSVPGENTDLTVVRGGDDLIRRPLIQ